MCDELFAVGTEREVADVARTEHGSDLAARAQIDAPELARLELRDRDEALRRDSHAERRRHAALDDLTRTERDDDELACAAVRDEQHDGLAIRAHDAAEH